MTNVSTLAVRLYGDPISTFTYVGGKRTLFASNEAFIRDQNKPTLSVSVQENLSQLLTDFKPHRIKLPAV